MFKYVFKGFVFEANTVEELQKILVKAGFTGNVIEEFNKQVDKDTDEEQSILESMYEDQQEELDILEDVQEMYQEVDTTDKENDEDYNLN
jgi:hypothetical protein